MSALRRTAVLVALTVGVVLGAGIPASATFADSVGMPPSTVQTAVVAAPTGVTGSLTCGRTSATMNVSWTKSTSARVSGYRVVVHFSDGFDQPADLPLVTGTTWSAPISLYNAQAYQIQYSVETHTDYGWTAESTRTGWFQC